MCFCQRASQHSTGIHRPSCCLSANGHDHHADSFLAGSWHPDLISSLVGRRTSSGKLDSGLTGGSEPRRSSARAPKRKTPARQDRDEEASLTSRSARANSSAGEATPFSPPTLVWESQPLYQVGT